MLPTPVSTGQQAASNPRSLECGVTSHASTRFNFDEVNALRKTSHALPGNVGNGVLRHCDEQTLAALVAVRDAIGCFETPPTTFEDWGIVFSSRYLGRTAFAQSLDKFAIDGPWNVSVQVVPHRSLHSPASMVGLCLGCHGPCVGVGGGLDGETDAWLTAITLLEQHSLPGLWLVFSGWEPEVQIALQGTWLGQTQCTALAMALQPMSAEHVGLRLRVVYDSLAAEELEIPAKNTAISLFENFVASGTKDGAMNLMLGGSLRAQIDYCEAAAPTVSLPLSNSQNQRKAA